MPVSLIILAAGQGTRMNSERPKVLHKLAAAQLLHHAMAAARALDPARTVVVAGHGAGAVAKSARAFDETAEIVLQDEQLGTGHAVARAAPLLADAPGEAIVLYGDTPFIRAETLEAMLEARARHAVVVLGFEARDPGRYGRLILDGESLARIVEYKDASDAERAVTLCNSGVICAGAKDLFALVADLSNDNAAGEYYLTDIVALARARGPQIVKNKSVLRKLIRAGTEIVQCGFNEEAETKELLEKAEKSLFSVTQTFIQNKLTPIKDILNARYEEFAAIHADPTMAQHSSIPIGYASFDFKLGGFKRGDLVILAARPSMGKTAMSLNFAQNVAETGRHVAIFSLEMSKEQLTDRLIAAAMAVDSWKLQKGKLSEDEFAKMGDALEKLSRSKIYMDDSPAGAGLVELKSKARRLKMESGLDLVTIDYLQLIRTEIV